MVTPLADGTGFVKIFRDLTERRAAERRVRESEALFRLLATNVPQLVFRTTATGDRTWASPQWIAYTGYPLETSKGFSWIDAIHPQDRHKTIAAWAEARETGGYYAEHRIRRADDGEYRWHQTRARPVTDEGDWVGTSTDVHGMHELQECQKILLAELQHRTRSLLAVVQSIARQTMRTSGSTGEFVAEFESRLRALSRVQILLAQGSIDLHDLIEVELKAHGDGEVKPGKVSIRGPRALLPTASAQVLALAIHELATNALKHGALGQSSGKLDIAWHIEEAPERRVILDWRETGVVMAGGAGAPSRKGYGRELIERALPYQLKAETRLEFGSDGVRCQIRTAIVSEDADDERQPSFPLRGRRVLVVEDEYMIAIDLQRSLEARGVSVIGPVGTVSDALALLADGKTIDAAVLDINLGREEVFPLADALKKRAVPIVFATGYEEWIIPIGFSDSPRIEKPIDVEALTRLLGATIDSHPQRP